MSDAKIFIRQWNILRALSADQNGWTLADLARRFGISTKTAKRDLILLEQVFGELQNRNEQHGRKRYYLNRLILTFNLSLNNSELLAFYIGRKLMSPLQGTCFWKGIQTGSEKIKQALSENTIDYAERVAPCFHQFEYTGKRYQGKGDLINVLLDAMEQFQVVKITYQSIASDKAKTYEIHPYNFVYHGGSIYIVGFSCKDKEIRFWKTDRLEKIHKENQTFDPPENFDIDKYMANAIAPFISEEGIVHAQIRFKKSCARYVLEQKLKMVKKTIKEKDGSIKLEMDVENGKPFLRWILGFGKNAEIIGPPELRTALKNEINEINAQYQ